MVVEPPTLQQASPITGTWPTTAWERTDANSELEAEEVDMNELIVNPISLIICLLKEEKTEAASYNGHAKDPIKWVERMAANLPSNRTVWVIVPSIFHIWSLILRSCLRTACPRDNLAEGKSSEKHRMMKKKMRHSLGLTQQRKFKRIWADSIAFRFNRISY